MKILRGHRKVYFTAALAIILSFLLVHIVQAVNSGSSDPGTDNDPIVSQSYVDAKINSILTKVNELGTFKDGLTKSVNQLSSEVADLTNKVNNSSAPDNSDLTKKVFQLSVKVEELANAVKNIKAPAVPQYQLYKLLKGKQMTPAPGTELIVRTGAVRAVKGRNGNILDLTLGTEVGNTSNLPINRLLLAHMDDGRGIKALKDSWILVKGKYTVK